MKKLVLIDGSSLLSTSFFGLLPKEYLYAKTTDEKKKALSKVMQTSEGVFTNGVYTMSKSLMQIIDKQSPDYFAVAWDLTRNTFRKALYEGYKAQRKETAPELKSQFILMQEVLEKMNIKQFMNESYEADDFLGSLSERFKDEVMVFILTKDQDALQLVDENVRVWLMTSKHKEMYSEIGLAYGELTLPTGVFEHTPETIRHFYGLKRPEQIVDMKAIEGDTSDNIPGVAGVGSKSVIPLLQAFDTVENLYEALQDLDKEKEEALKNYFKGLGIKRSPIKNLVEGQQYAFLSKQLATINRFIPEVQDLELEALRLSINKEGKNEMFQKLEFNSLL